MYLAAAEKPASKVLISKSYVAIQGYGEGVLPLFDAFAKKSSSECLSKVQFKAGLFTAVVVVLRQCAETRLRVLLSEALPALTACGVS